MNFFDHAIFCFAIFLLFLRHFSPNFVQMSPLNLARHFCGINCYLYSFLTALSRLVVCKFLVPAQTFWTKLLLRPSAANDVKWRLFAGKTRMYNVRWSVYDAKIGFYCSNEVILSLFFTEIFFYFFASSLVSYYVKKTARKGRFRIFFYLHANE